MDKEKSITDQLEEIRDQMCNNYCHYPFIWDEDQDGELCESEYCQNCPLSRL